VSKFAASRAGNCPAFGEVKMAKQKYKVIIEHAGNNSRCPWYWKVQAGNNQTVLSRQSRF